ncbi:MAG: NAD(P)-dependent oxidoreductase [Lachnospiraceae bacterium]|nr:NAD(P)-dependent oxidoreductase [Lachnospiraceae bacterium]
MKIVITGATGYLGKELIRQLKNSEYEIYALTSELEKAEACFREYDITILSNESLLNDPNGIIDENCVIIHGAFCRKSLGSGLTQSLHFSRRLYQMAVEKKAAGILNLSSQSVYGSDKAMLGAEDSELSPGYLYALAKYGSEEMLSQAIHFSYGTTVGCSLRLASLVGPTDKIPENVLYKFICSALDSEKISIVGGYQKFSFLDVRDAAQAITILLKKEPVTWKSVYNLGPLRQTDIIEMAALVKNEVEKFMGGKIDIIVNSDDKHDLNAGMDSSLLYQDLKWVPPHDFSDIVRDSVRFILGRPEVLSS